MYLTIGMNSECLTCSGLEQTWGKSSVKQRTRVWASQPVSRRHLVKQVASARVGVFLCVAHLSYVENIPEGPRGGGVLGLISECGKTLCGVQRCGQTVAGRQGPAVCAGLCWSPERPPHRGRAHSPLPRVQASGCMLLWPVQRWGHPVGAAGEWARGGLAVSQMPWGDCDDDGDAHVTAGQ